MAEDVIIRPYTDTDYPAVEAILKAANQHDEVWDHRENLSSMITRDPESVLVAEADGEVVGSLYMVWFGKQVAYLFRLSVKASHRKRGIGTKLLEESSRILRKRGAKEVALLVNEAREDLRPFYEKRGYQTSGNKYFVMWKKL